MKEKLIKAEVLKEVYEIPTSKYDREYTKTAQFMVKSIGINLSIPIINKFFKNAFLGDREHKHNYERPIFLLFSIKDFKDLEWKSVYKTLVKSKNYISEYDVGVQNDSFLLMMVFSVPKEYAEDYYNFRIGRYSLFSKKYKEKFLKYLDKDETRINLLWQAIHKDDKLREINEKAFGLSDGFLKDANEIWDKPRMEREYYRFKK